MGSQDPVIYQPLHPSIRAKLDSEYVAFHDKVLQYVPPAESMPWDPRSRLIPSPLARGGQQPVEVGKVYDRDLGPQQVRVFVPEGDAPDGGWPGMMWLHGGGWVNGGLNSENGFLRHVCKRKSPLSVMKSFLNHGLDVKCLVVSINYRHAPEYPYPTAVEDALYGLAWILSAPNAASLQLDTCRLAIGGLSA